MIGRPITAAEQPQQAVEAILQEMGGKAMTEAEVRQLFVETGAILEGHFLLTSGLHSPLYVEKFQVLQYPQHTAALCKALADRFASEQVELVIGPITGGILLAHEVGKNLGTSYFYRT